MIMAEQSGFEIGFSEILPSQFIVAAHRSQFEEIGSYVCVEHLGESIILCRNGTGQVRAFANVCRHRGSRIVDAGVGKVNEFHCPYHGWKYNLSGKFLSARLFTHISNSSLPEIPVIEKMGFFFISLERFQYENFLEFSSKLANIVESYKIHSLQLASPKEFVAQVNWKLFVQNFLDCYHCFNSHELLTRSEAFIRLIEEDDLRQLNFLDSRTRCKAKEKGKPFPSISPDPNSSVFWAIRGSTLLTKSETITGELSGHLLGDFELGDGSFLYGCIGPFNHFTILPDQVVFFRFMPDGLKKTNVKIYWLVHKETSLNQKSINDITGFWSRTINEDIRLTEAVQANSESRFKSQPMFLQYEEDAKLFTKWLARQ